MKQQENYTVMKFGMNLTAKDKASIRTPVGVFQIEDEGVIATIAKLGNMSTCSKTRLQKLVGEECSHPFKLVLKYLLEDI